MALSNETITTIILSSASALFAAMVASAVRQKEKRERMMDEMQSMITQLVELRLQKVEAELNAEKAANHGDHTHNEATIRELKEKIKKLDSIILQLSKDVAKHDGALSEREKME